jgi:hypothetical protein
LQLLVNPSAIDAFSVWAEFMVLVTESMVSLVLQLLANPSANDDFGDVMAGLRVGDRMHGEVNPQDVH